MLIMIHADHADFAACVHAVMLPVPNLVIYHFIQVFAVSCRLFFALLLPSFWRFNSPIHFYLYPALVIYAM